MMMKVSQNQVAHSCQTSFNLLYLLEKWNSFDEDKEEFKEKEELNIQRFKNCGLVLMLDLLSTFDRPF